MSNRKNMEYQLLMDLKKDFDEGDIPCIFRSAQEENLPTDILTTLHRRFGRSLDEVMGEFYFFPMPEDSGTPYYFTSIITLTEEMEAHRMPVVAEAIRVLNFYLQCGSFNINRQGNLLCFKFVTPIPEDLSYAQALELANINVGHSLQLTERYTDALLSLADGSSTLEHFMELMPEV